MKCIILLERNRFTICAQTMIITLLLYDYKTKQWPTKFNMRCCKTGYIQLLCYSRGDGQYLKPASIQHSQGLESCKSKQITCRFVSQVKNLLSNSTRWCDKDVSSFNEDVFCKHIPYVQASQLQQHCLEKLFLPTVFLWRCEGKILSAKITMTDCLGSAAHVSLELQCSVLRDLERLVSTV